MKLSESHPRYTVSISRFKYNMAGSMMYIHIVVFLILLACTECNCNSPGTLEMLNQIKQNYSKEIRPFAGGEPLNVTCTISVSAFSAVDMANMDYTVTFYFRLTWVDPRLQSDFPHILLFQSDAVEMIWIPLIIFPHEKDGKLHALTDENQIVQIWPNGTVSLTMRLSMTLVCHMKTGSFPMDSQQCPLVFQSLAYPETDLQLIWGEVLMNKDLHVPSFKLGPHVLKSCESDPFQIADMSCLEVVFLLDRSIVQVLLQVYLTSTLVVGLSWISFWINPRSEPARVTLGMTSVLTLSTEITGVQVSLPIATYASAIDVWLAVCLMFVFAVLIEFAVLNYANTKLTRQLATMNHSQQPKENDKIEGDVVVEMEMKPSEDKDKNEPYVSYKGTRWQRCQHFFRVDEPDDLDRISRVMFPLAFIIFCTIYWLSYLMT